jgi:HEAT repeat protein
MNDADARRLRSPRSCTGASWFVRSASRGKATDLGSCYLGFRVCVVLLSLLLPPLTSAAQARVSDQAEAAVLVEELANFPAELPAGGHAGIDPLEQRREEIYERLRALDRDAIPALSRGLKAADVRIRRNVALVLVVLAGRWYKPSAPQLDISLCLSALIEALADTDQAVRARAAQAIGEIGADAVAALPALVLLVEYTDEGSRIGACIGLRGLGPAANAALPALRKALDDQSKDVRQFAAHTIDAIEASPRD